MSIELIYLCQMGKLQILAKFKEGVQIILTSGVETFFSVD